MDNHYHLLVETPEPNLSRAMQWLSVSYSVWFNRRHRRWGHLFGGRFKGIVVEDDAGWQEVARYVHLNPVRVAALGLGKPERAASRAGWVGKPPVEVVTERLRVLREYRWSSYRGYAGYGGALSWVWTEPLGRVCGGRSLEERQEALRQYTEGAVKQGVEESPWARLVGGMVLGTEGFARRLAKAQKGSSRERRQLKLLVRPVGWGEIVSVVEQAKGEKWTQFRERRGDWGREAVLWLGRRQGRLRLRELGGLAGGMDYAAVAQAVRRFGQRVERDEQLRGEIKRMETTLSNV
jgi:hypothetical protein